MKIQGKNVYAAIFKTAQKTNFYNDDLAGSFTDHGKIVVSLICFICLWNFFKQIESLCPTTSNLQR